MPHMADFKAKMHIIRFPLDLRPTPRWVSLQHSPRSREGNWRKKERKRSGKGEEGKGGKGLPRPGPQIFWPRTAPAYGTRGTRPLKLWRQWGRSVFGPLQLLQLAVIFRWALWEADQTSSLN